MFHIRSSDHNPCAFGFNTQYTPLLLRTDFMHLEGIRKLLMLLMISVSYNNSIKSFYHVQIQEIITTGKLSKLEHFETDEKVL